MIPTLANCIQFAIWLGSIGAHSGGRRRKKEGGKEGRREGEKEGRSEQDKEGGVAIQRSGRKNTLKPHQSNERCNGHSGMQENPLGMI